MECKSASEGANCGGDGGISVCEDGGAGWLTSTPHPPRRPLQHLNTASPRPPLTPYRYHGCKAIPEEREDQENIDPASKVIQESCVSVKSSGMSPENTNTTHTGSGSSPFAYPLIWEASHSTTSSSPSEKKPIADLTTWRSPVSHYRATESQAKEEVKEEEGKEGKEGGGKVRNRSGSSSEVSLSKVACHGPSVTPSKAPHTQTLSNTSSLFLTPSSSMHSSRPWESRGGQTPKQQRVAFSASGHVNPFEVGAESLYLSAVSPSLFRQVVSPSQKTDMNFRWSIDQMATLEPVNIETSPFMQVETFVDPEYERQAQDAIDRFFTQSVIPSPWTGSNKSVSVVKKMCVQQSQASPSLPLPRTQSVWCQTELTLPPVLPVALEEALKPFCTFTQNQGWQGSSEGDEAGCLNNTTLRRKLLFGHDDLASNTPSSQGGSEPSSPSPPRSLHDLRSPTHAAEGHKITEEEVEDVGLVWCTSPLAPGSISEEIEGGSKMRQSPHTSPSAHGPALSSTTQAALRPHTEDKLLSPDISPIHHHQYSDTEVKQTVSCVSLEGSYLELPHATNTFAFANKVSAVSSGPHLSASLVSGAGESSGTGNQWRRSTGEQHTFSPTHSSTQHHQQPCMEAMGSEVFMGTEEEAAKEEEEDERQKIVSMKDSFSSQDDDQDMKCRSPVTSSPTAQLRASSNSGHFSSSPRQDLSHSPLEVDSPARKFSVSPPLSPIFCRPLLFPTQPSCRPQSVNVKEVKGGLEVTLMEESEVCCVPAAATTTLPRCSTLCDVEMDSQPLVESHLGEEMASQDTGYQTASATSLLTSNYSTTTFPQDPAPLAPMSDTTKHSLPTSKECRPSIV
ncbi:uncharacterized protein LOC123512708 isoform X3 [Portunus trituberculatus]|uniref:uncharacterized protein LOC123512708 isoform X3 n=1 Tax=Portunus trituberculatus TaxID=210409 RepID=UPI001E1CF3EE|nr:uncharacterized protein LOC123512708 isoform X3 [Portunus trituberculatus]